MGILDNYFSGIKEALETSYDFWSGRHPSERRSPQYNWNYRQIAGYENHPRYNELKQAFDAVPYSSALGDLRLVKEISGYPNAVGSYNEDTNIAEAIPFEKKGYTSSVTAHELGHSWMRNTRNMNSEPRAYSTEIAFNKGLHKEGLSREWARVMDLYENNKREYNKEYDKYVPDYTKEKNKEGEYKSYWGR